MNFKVDHKRKFLDELFLKYEGVETHILDMGCGTAANFIEILKNNKNFHYTGIEFNQKSFSAARHNLENFSNVILLNGYGEELKGKLNTYDIVLSLSVLEHVKYLEKFLVQSISMCKPGGIVIHRYDLGHSLYPSNFSEKVNVWLSLKAPFLISKKKVFTTHPSLQKITGILAQNGLKQIETDHSQAFTFKKLINKLSPDIPGDNLLAKKILEFEDELKHHFLSRLNEQEKEIIFPTITVKGTKG